MNTNLIRTISQEVYRRFPDFAGVQPKVQLQKTAPAKNNSPSYLFTFQSKGSAAGNKSLPRWVRVVANEDGKILKITTSR